ncbi:MAG: cob(I)yrinic acid a,c-diamide adenosyltransferase [Planctomycetota bacterium]
MNITTPRVLLFTGDGKGKTTAALGMLLRASGHGLRALMLQFIKSDTTTGELTAAKRLPGVEIIQTGRGFVPKPDHPKFQEHVEAARAGLRQASEALSAKKYDLLVLDEICTAISRKLLDEKAVIEALATAKGDVCLVLTGRDATPGLLALADTATEMRCLKHGLTNGILAQKGVEF